MSEQQDKSTPSQDDGRSSVRSLEEGIERDFSENLSYGDYLDLGRILGAQHPRSDPARHDELLFIVQHQTSELWLKLMIHELSSARDLIASDEIPLALKRFARVKAIQTTMTEQWSVLATLTPSEYAEFRVFLATGSGFQSHQYRLVEFILGNKDAQMLPVFAHDGARHQALSDALRAPSLYDAVLRHLHRQGYAVPADRLEPQSTAVTVDSRIVDMFAGIYADPAAHWRPYELAEELVDLEDNFQLWRFRHLRTVQRIIGSKPGTGGSSGVPFLRRALDLTFFPDLYEVRAQIQDQAPDGYADDHPQGSSQCPMH